jgi:hypothetical protein
MALDLLRWPFSASCVSVIIARLEDRAIAFNHSAICDDGASC